MGVLGAAWPRAEAQRDKHHRTTPRRHYYVTRSTRGPHTAAVVFPRSVVGWPMHSNLIQLEDWDASLTDRRTLELRHTNRHALIRVKETTFSGDKDGYLADLWTGADPYHAKHHDRQVAAEDSIELRSRVNVLLAEVPPETTNPGP